MNDLNYVTTTAKLKESSLWCKEGSADKEYHIWIEPQGSGFLVQAQWGRRGGPMQAGCKTPKPVPMEDAEKILDKVVREKLKEITLHSTEGTSDKLYTLWMEPENGGFLVKALYGRRGGPMAPATKTPAPVSKEKAEAVYAKVMAEKLGITCSEV